MNSDFRIAKSDSKYCFQREIESQWRTLHKVKGWLHMGILWRTSIEDLIMYMATASDDNINTECNYCHHVDINDNITWIWTSEQMKTEFPEWFI